MYNNFPSGPGLRSGHANIHGFKQTNEEIKTDNMEQYVQLFTIKTNNKWSKAESIQDSSDKLL